MTEYVMYTGDYQTTVGVWKREGETEIPIYANTRGASEWFSTDVNVSENVQQTKLSDPLIQALGDIWANMQNLSGGGVIDTSGLEWYEIEFLNAIGDPIITPEQEELLEWAYNEVQE